MLRARGGAVRIRGIATGSYGGSGSDSRARLRSAARAFNDFALSSIAPPPRRRLPRRKRSFVVFFPLFGSACGATEAS